jgi:AraC-like DNA-binding protein
MIYPVELCKIGNLIITMTLSTKILIFSVKLVYLAPGNCLTGTKKRIDNATMERSFTIAAGWVNRFYRGLIEWGVPEEKLFNISKLRLSDLKDADERIPFDQYMNLGRMAPELTGTPEIGLNLGQNARFQDIGVVFQLAHNCGTVRESLLQTVRYSNLGNEVSIAIFEESGKVAEWAEHYLSARYLCIPLIEFECCQKLEILKSVLGKGFRPVQTKFQYEPPDYVDKYSQVFQSPLLFGQEKSGIVFKKEYLDVRNPNPQPYIKEILARHADKLKIELEKSKGFQDKVRKIIIKHLDSGNVNMEMISNELNLSSRTLCRKLKEENISYKDLLIDIKKQLAQAYLEETSFTLNEISYFLGFSEASAFHRAFKRWFGTNPSQYRRKARLF